MDRAFSRKSGSSHGSSSSAAQPAASASSCGAAQPSVTWGPSLGGTSSSAVQPAARSADLVQQAQNLGHFPRRFKKAETVEQKAEDSLAKKISMAWVGLPEADKQALTALKEFGGSAVQPATGSADLVGQVQKLGHYPRRFKEAKTVEQKAENNLAVRISKAWAALPEADKQTLSAVQAQMRSESQHTQETQLLERLRALGRWPVKYASPTHPQQEQERQLAKAIWKARKSGRLSAASEAEIDEIHWMHQRELQAKSMEADVAATNAVRKARQETARQRRARLQRLLASLQTSRQRCDCHDFAHWCALWRSDSHLACRLRLAGHHFSHCQLARSPLKRVASSAAQPASKHPRKGNDDAPAATSSAVQPEARNADLAESDDNLLADFQRLAVSSHGAQFDADSGNPLLWGYKGYLGDPMCDPKTTFENAGLVAACKDCGGAIVCGVLHSGCPSDYSDLSEADHHMVTFLHHCRNAKCQLDTLARGWESHMVPLAVTPGSDVGMESADYRWILKQCKAKADWQLPQRLTFSGRLAKKKAATFQHRGRPPHFTECGFWDKTDEIDGSQAPFGEWRARCLPLTQEPEWTLNDLNVKEAWCQVDLAALDECSPAAMLALASDAVNTLGRWPVSLPPGLCAQTRRLEVRLALVLNAYMSKPLSTHGRKEFFDAIRYKRQIRALRSSALQPAPYDRTRSAAQPAPDSAAAARWRSKLRELGLDIKPVEGKQVFCHTPSKTILQHPCQMQVLQKFGAYAALKLWKKQLGDVDKLFMFTRDFVHFNRTGMRAEDPHAHKWRESKVWINYTQHVGANDWANALTERQLCEVLDVKDQLREGETPRASPGDIMGPRSRIWDWYVQTHADGDAEAALRAARAKLTGSLLKQNLDFQKAFHAVSKTQESKYSQYEFKTRFVNYQMPLFLWAGGTYARREADFPKAQSTVMWIDKHILPLGIRSPGVHFCESIEKADRTWKQAQWYGKAPDPCALMQPFPYATASMRDFIFGAVQPGFHHLALFHHLAPASTTEHQRV